MDRRVFLKYLAASASAAALPTLFNACSGFSPGGNRSQFQDSHANPTPAPTPRVVPADAVNVKNFGAKGDGVTNDTDAFAAASRAIEQAGGGTLFVPAGTYIVGKQSVASPTSDQYWFADTQPIISISGCTKPVVIMGEAGTKLRSADGLYFGSFDRTTGLAYNPPSMPFTDPDYLANACVMIDTGGNVEITIEDFELDGNLAGLKLGGEWGDTGRQCAAIGIRSLDDRKLTIKNIYTHHHGEDGIGIGYYGVTEASPLYPVVMENVVSEYNARQGFSWIGGNSLIATNCKFNHTGKARFQTAPGAGLDVEAEDSICRNGHFTNCEFANNTGCGIVADSGDSAHLTFTGCSVWGTTMWSIWAAKPYIKFENCNIHGTMVNLWSSATNPDEAVKFIGCTIDDSSHPTFGPSFNDYPIIYIAGAAPHVTFDGCTITALRNFSANINNNSVTTPVVIRNSTFIHGNPPPSDATPACFLWGVKLENVQFKEAFATPPQHYSTIDCRSVVIGNNVTVSGPKVFMFIPGHIESATGTIPPGTYV